MASNAHVPEGRPPESEGAFFEPSVPAVTPSTVTPAVTPPTTVTPTPEEDAATPSPRKRRSKLKRTLSLQTQLIIVILMVCVVGLAASSTAVTTIMRGILINRVDEDLIASLDGWTQDPNIVSSPVVVGPPSEFSVLLISDRGWPTWVNAGDSRPNFGQVPIDGVPRTVGSLAGSEEELAWRAVGRETDDGITIVAKSLDNENSILNGLIAVQVGISALVVILIAIGGIWVVRRAIRPLREVESTARAIAAGNLDRRVPEWPLTTEVGQLSASLNTMLGRLQESIETSQEQERHMRRFIGDASHELRTPLTSVRGYTELYRSGATKDVDLVLDKIDEESGRMKLLVEDLLALTLAEGKRLDLRPVDVLELALGARTSAMAAFPGREIAVVNDAKEVPVVNGDPDRLHQALLNLVSNAMRHAGEEAKATIRVREDGRSVCIDVIDDGKGMSRDVSDHIFERFYRADSSRSRGSGGGSGLGLSITKAIVEQHSGEISVESEVGVGSTFTIRLPRLLNPSNVERG